MDQTQQSNEVSDLVPPIVGVNAADPTLPAVGAGPPQVPEKQLWPSKFKAPVYACFIPTKIVDGRPVKAKCKQCRKELSCKVNTSHLNRHMKEEHPETFLQNVQPAPLGIKTFLKSMPPLPRVNDHENKLRQYRAYRFMVLCQPCLIIRFSTTFLSRRFALVARREAASSIPRGSVRGQTLQRPSSTTALLPR